MWPVWTLEEARAADRTAQEQGVPYAGLLSVAGFQLARFIQQRQPHGSLVILAGPGANGGDGWVAARNLARHFPVTIVPVAEPRFGGADGWVKAARQGGVEVVSGQEAEHRLRNATLVVDAIFGTGFHGTVGDSLAGPWLRLLSELALPVMAVDLPSGVNTDTGAYDGPVLNLRAIVTMGAAKWGLIGYPGAELSSNLVIADIGLPRRSFATPSAAWIEPEWAAARLPGIKPLAHKYSRGHVVVIGGSRAMPGAPILAATAALKAGAGLVEVIVPKSAVGAIFSPSLIVHREAETPTGDLCWSERLEQLARRADALVVGPGLGRGVSPELLAGLARLSKPAVVDADAIRLVKQIKAPLPKNWVVTPHAEEMGFLLDRDAASINADRRGAVLEAVSFFKCPFLLKGRFSLIAHDHHIWVNPTGSPALATAGSGDVLSGLAARLLASGLEPQDALALAVYWHGWAGELGEQAEGVSLTSESLMSWIGPAFKVISELRKPKSLTMW